MATGIAATLTTDLTGGQIFNGIVVKLGAEVEVPTAITKIKELPNVLTVTPNEQIEMPKVNPKNVIDVPNDGGNRSTSHGQMRLSAAAVNQLYSNVQVMMQVDTLRKKGITGKGIRVAVIDAKVGSATTLFIYVY